MGRIYLNFKRPDDNPLWIGVKVYVKKGVSGEYELKKQVSTVTVSVKLDTGGIDDSQTIIPFDVSTLYGSFPSAGSFWIEDELISYTSIDDIDDEFEGCTRGGNASAHADTEYCQLKGTYTPFISFNDSDIGSTWYIKIVSMNIAGVVSALGDATAHTVVLV